MLKPTPRGRPRDEKVIAMLKSVKAYTAREIAEACGCSVSKVYSARAWLAKQEGRDEAERS